MPSGIRFASFRANRISLKPQGFNITIAQAIISLFARAKNITKKQRRESFTEFCNCVTFSSAFIAGFARLLHGFLKVRIQLFGFAIFEFSLLRIDLFTIL